MKRTLLIFFSIIQFGFVLKVYGQYCRLENDLFVIGNNRIERSFLWNGGNLISHSITDKQSGQRWMNLSDEPDFCITAENIKAQSGRWVQQRISANEMHPAYLECEISFLLGELEVKRVYRIYDDLPVFVVRTRLRGCADGLLVGDMGNSADLKNIEFSSDMKGNGSLPVLDRISLGGKHWRLRSVEFFDVTDRNNTLVFEYDALSYRRNFHRGNILFARNEENEHGLFFIKEAPCSSVQLEYPGADFVSEFGSFAVVGPGIAKGDIKVDEWTETYGCVMGVFSGGEYEALSVLRSYQKCVRNLLPQRDEMVMMNTWGDRGQDTKVNESFCLAEVERAAQLGISHFQIDDGWQSGKSPNSALASGSFKNIWSNPDYWRPDKKKYPRGLTPIVERGKQLGVEICLWYNPSVQDDFADWEKDAGAIVGLYREYGIRTFKIDGLALPTKRAEINLRKLFDRVLEETGNEVVFNLDVTAGRRGGYHYFNEYGNIFLENRYTDWQNYFPYWTLRNLWLLSKYVPAEKLQVEFLNKWRNSELYGCDVFAPANYSFDYLFAITMAGQPLAWFEGSNLPSEALALKEVILSYREIQHDLHSGIILPIGDEPSGKSWTGFQSVNGKRGYFIFYRENHPESMALIKTWLPEGTQIACTPLLGCGVVHTATIGDEGVMRVELPKENSFVLYEYRVID